MPRLLVRGHRPLYGQYTVPAAKNAVLPILAACVCVEGEVRLVGCPRLSDVDAMLDMLRSLGARAQQQGDLISVDCSAVSGYDCTGALAGCMRSSLFLLGSVLARMGEVRLGYPGGCVIGSRPIDIHLAGLRAMGVEVRVEEGVLYCSAAHRHAARFRLPFPSVGATVNLMLFATSVEGVSEFFNVAVEPEVLDVVSFLQRAGANVVLRGTTLTVVGKKPLSGLTYRPIGDRVAAATVLVACAMTGGEVRVRGVAPIYCRPLLDKIGKSSCIRTHNCGTIDLRSTGRVHAVSAVTGPYPAFATDMQALVVAYNAVAHGHGLVREGVFESRFAIAKQLARMGADVRIVGNCAVSAGRRLRAADCTCCDLRAGAALVCAALTVDGISTIDNVGLIDRGYQHIEQVFASLGADIKRIDER